MATVRCGSATTPASRAPIRAHANSQVWEQGSAHDAPLAGPNDLIAQTPDGRVWVSSLGEGIQARDGDGRVLFAIRPGDGLGLAAADTEQLGASPQGALWLAGAQGLLAWNEALHRFAPVPGAPDERVFGFAFADPHTLWLHRLSALECYGWDGHALSLQLRVDQKRGLPAVESGGVIADARGDVWLTTVRGLLRFDARSGQVRVYGVRDGLPSQEFGRHPPMLTKDGIAAAGTVDGLVLFEPAKVPLDSAVPRLAIDAISVRRGDREVAMDTLPSAGRARITLGPDDRDLRVDARLLSYTDPKAHRYRYWLHGYDAGWLEQRCGWRTGVLAARSWPLPVEHPGDQRRWRVVGDRRACDQGAAAVVENIRGVRRLRRACGVGVAAARLVVSATPQATPCATRWPNSAARWPSRTRRRSRASSRTWATRSARR